MCVCLYAEKKGKEKLRSRRNHVYFMVDIELCVYYDMLTTRYSFLALFLFLSKRGAAFCLRFVHFMSDCKEIFFIKILRALSKDLHKRFKKNMRFQNS